MLQGPQDGGSQLSRLLELAEGSRAWGDSRKAHWPGSHICSSTYRAKGTAFLGTRRSAVLLVVGGGGGAGAPTSVTAPG